MLYQVTKNSSSLPHPLTPHPLANMTPTVRGEEVQILEQPREDHNQQISAFDHAMNNYAEEAEAVDRLLNMMP